MVDSVVAAVHRGDNDGDHLSLDAAERARSPHEFHVQFVMLPHDAAVYTVNADDVISVCNSVARRDSFIGLIGYERHRRYYSPRLAADPKFTAILSHRV